MARPPNRRRGFTIVELLVVIAVIGILLALIASGIGAALKGGRKTRELNNIKSVVQAWSVYSYGNDGALLPGFLPAPTQSQWKVSYRNKTGDVIATGLAQTYPWRLAKLLDYSYEPFLGYAPTAREDIDADFARQWMPHPAALPQWMDHSFDQPGSMVALQPAFGYNAYYLGGWYESSGGVSLPEYLDAPFTTANGGTKRGVVATTDAQIGDHSKMVAFAASTYRPPGRYKVSTSDEDTTPGCAWVTPPYLAQTQMWTPSVGTARGIVLSERSMDQQAANFLASGLLASSAQSEQADPGRLDVMVTGAVPFRRYNRQVATAFADGSTISAVGVGDLMNMEHWVRSAWKPDFRHDP